jgi:hypothetical protein
MTIKLHIIIKFAANATRFFGNTETIFLIRTATGVPAYSIAFKITAAVRLNRVISSISCFLSTSVDFGSKAALQGCQVCFAV